MIYWISHLSQWNSTTALTFLYNTFNAHILKYMQYSKEWIGPQRSITKINRTRIFLDRCDQTDTVIKEPFINDVSSQGREGGNKNGTLINFQGLTGANSY